MRLLHPAAAELDDVALEKLYATDRSVPRLRMNFVASVDGGVSVDGLSAGLQSPADKRVFKLLRGWCDGLVVAAGTALAEDYGPVTLDAERRARREAAGLAPTPTLVVVSGSLSIPPDHASLVRAPVRPIVVTGPDAPADRRRAIEEVADVVDDVDFVAALHARGLSQLLCEGGPRLFASLTAADDVDEICLTISPQLAGGGPGRISAGPHSPDPRSLALAHVVEDEGVLLLRYCRPSLLH
ncbi:dihydrofolate reductase family protein [Cryptosporangium arvum]|uniref:Pyrimidine reductase, riboflavin biosynthesis n=1 Tax=Cryptosporangium arvum DSM 44712 TaxID=927661 RepID=A0A010ZQI5_9ACTN|nr:dihydrofolate reductase family protein [Cryptosporangium arvum]EXG80939.1 pyrimidine reductase, riboflavin biosynthesis [Cryptosporangium arvum DSM 44712]